MIVNGKDLRRITVKSRDQIIVRNRPASFRFEIRQIGFFAQFRGNNTYKTFHRIYFPVRKSNLIPRSTSYHCNAIYFAQDGGVLSESRNSPSHLPNHAFMIIPID